MSVPHDVGRFGRVALIVLVFVCAMFATGDARADDSTEESIAAYADAANFQTNGAFDLAIDGWKSFLKKYPKDEMASKAAHYLGVCYMQKESPDYLAAAESFSNALKDKGFELRQESLANQGWCWFASAGEGANQDESRLRKAIGAYDQLRRESPRSQFVDRALFYSGEAAYALGEQKRAVDYYNKMLALPSAKDSPLRCEALYARGIAQEELDQFDDSLASFQQLLTTCDNEQLITDVHLRMGDVLIFRKDYAKAVSSFAAALKSAESDEDKSYAMFRQAFALVQGGRPAEAAKKYALLDKQFPNSKYAGTALLASAQSSYRSGDLDAAAKGFQSVLKQKSKTASTEAAHWLARIYISKGQADQAAQVAQRQIENGVEGEYSVDLKLDLAEALSLNPQTVAKSVDMAESIYRESPDDELAPRALYTAAFSALQINQAPKALKLAKEFLNKFPKDTLGPDVQFITAEAYLLTGQLSEASKSYERLLKQTPPAGNVQRASWVLRAATTTNAAKKYDDTLRLMKREYKTLPQPVQKAEAQMLIGQAFLMTKKYDDAALAFRRSQDVAPNWPRADEAQLRAGTALFAGGKEAEAKSVWQQLSNASKSRMGDQARYKLAQMASNEKNFATAIKLYDQILASKQDPGLLPYTLYGKGWCLMQNDSYSDAIGPLDQVLKDFKRHPVGDDAMLARGISLRHLGRFDRAAEDLTEYLALKPQGTNLGHALYELALIDQKQKKPGQAATRLKRLVEEVPEYPSMDKVLYELGWSLRESGDEPGAEKQFAELVRRFPKADVAGEAAYFVGQKNYAAGKWKEAAKQFLVATQRTTDQDLSEKAHYRLGWSHFKAGDFNEAEKAFADQSTKHASGRLALDALMMVGECRFETRDYASALVAYTRGRDQIRSNNDNARSVRDTAERRVRELILLHGGQSAAQLKRWDEAINWYDELKERFPSTSYLPQMFYETGFAYQQKREDERALKYFSQVADNYRNEIAARARFMMGEIYFSNKQFDKAIPEFQRVMFGFGAEKAPKEIKNWQAKSGFEAGRCSEQLMQQAKSEKSREKSREFAENFFQYVVDKHADHDLFMKAREHLDKIK